MTENKLIGLKELHSSRMMYWINTESTLRKWIQRDMKGKNYLNAVYVKPEGKLRGRWFVNVDKVKEYVEKFQTNTLEF